MRASVAKGAARRDVLAPLKAAEIVAPKAALPAGKVTDNFRCYDLLYDQH